MKTELGLEEIHSKDWGDLMHMQGQHIRDHNFWFAR